MTNTLDAIMIVLGWIIIIYMAFVILAYSTMLIIALIQLRKYRDSDQLKKDDDYIDSMFSKPVSIIVPAYNEEAGIIDSLHSLLSLRYPDTELIVVNDGSTDSTQKKIIDYFKMRPIDKTVRVQIQTKPINQIFQSTVYPHLFLIDKENGGKADALNAGINMSKNPYFCSIDGDSILDGNSLLRVMRPIILSDGNVIAAGGNVRIANGLDIHLGSIFGNSLSKNSLVLMQIVEYVRAFLMGRIALSKYNLILIISGAFSVFSKKHVIEVGGYSTNMIGEDMELVVHLHRYIKDKKLNKRIEFVADPVCWTEAPQSLSDLRKQRRRWHQGLIENLWKHKKMTLNPKYGTIGLISLPYFWIVECLGPIVELIGYLYIIISFFLGNLYFEYSILLILLFILYGSIFSIASTLLEAWSMNVYPKTRELTKVLFISLSEIFWYKPITLLFRCEGILRFILGRNDWGTLKRRGLSKEGVSK
ncbi:glycosyltransferase family 2 protein [Bacillus sp. AGMB 02131]|uniref:Glycosyltransferase family 2 protein n=1 Tax=Peribacillus faecalis TaxID=2772559 RepID=A0A927CW31_9BACI|nr:glycosyltransferase [Peribacillus faecalis]MBD3108688.1 glycosyltransferase family 2 protein [Peribacillus faecalis]